MNQTLATHLSLYNLNIEGRSTKFEREEMDNFIDFSKVYNFLLLSIKDFYNLPNENEMETKRKYHKIVNKSVDNS